MMREQLKGVSTMPAAIYILILVFVLVVNVIMATEFQEIAKEKGYPQSKYFWYVFLFGIVGCLLVIALPNKGTTGSIERHVSNSSGMPEL